MVEVDIYPHLEEFDFNEPDIEELAGLIESGLPGTDVAAILDFYETIYEGNTTVTKQLGRSALSGPTVTKTSERDKPDDDDDKNKDSVEWMKKAKCRGLLPSEFYPNDGTGVEIVQRICVVCPVRDKCLEHALNNGEQYGVWGGASERERRRILKRRRSV